jgi:hypothetical protein
MRLSWKRVAETVIAYIPLDDLEKAIATEKRYLKTELAKRMSASERAGVEHSIAFMEQMLREWR